MRRPTLSGIVALLVLHGIAFAAVPIRQRADNPSAVRSGDSIIVRRRTRIYKRQYGDKWKGPIVVSYPVVSGLANQSVLRRIQKTLMPLTIYDAEDGNPAADGWLQKITYKLNCNRHSVLDMTFIVSGTGAYPDDMETQITLDTRTGRKIRAADLFRADTMPALASKVRKVWRADIAKAIYAVDHLTDKDGNKTDRDAWSDEVHRDLDNLRFGVKDLEDFSIGPRGVTFRYEFGFPHVMKGAEPKGRYSFSFADLRPFVRRDGLLTMFVP